MSDYKPEVLPSGVMLRKIKSEDEDFILSNIDQALIVTNLDIAAMYGLAYPEEPINAEQAWHDVSQKLLESQLKQRTESTNECIACTIQERDEQVKQMPRHTCGIDGSNPGADELKNELQTDLNAVYNAEVRRIAEIIAHTPYNPEKWAGIEHFGEQVKERLVDLKMEEARAMVAEMAKVAKDFHHAGWVNRGAYDHPAHAAKVGQLDYLLIKRGLIPSPEKEQK